MMNLEEKKKMEIKRMVGMAEQIDLPGILVLTDAANILLMRQKEAERRDECMKKKAG